MQVNHVFASVFDNIDCSRSSASLSLASAAISATSSFAFLRFLASGFVAWTAGETRKFYGEQCRLYLKHRNDDDIDNGEATKKALRKVLKRHLKWLEQVAYSSQGHFDSTVVSKGLLAHLSEFNLFNQISGVAVLSC